MSIPTPHITAKKGDFARTVLMPGDPLRSKFIAETFLENAVLVNNVRGVQGYTGTYRGKKVSVMASGMGMPSIGIYSYELFNFYDVENIIRVGSAGATSPLMKLKDVAIGKIALTKSSFAENFGLGKDFIATASPILVEKAELIAKDMGVHSVTGTIFSSDVFYGEDGLAEFLEKNDVLAIEMEAAALYMNAYKAKKNALAICTISDSILTGEACSAEERQNSFTQMMEIALEMA
ncbi:MAG: purine-nucleoside phosphorylase [Clostridia bacterium]|nr:purine-nucleoside phosphorylase [Clostridia bacterium]